MKPPRIDYEKSSLSEQDVSKDPFEQFAHWWSDAITAQVDMPDAVHLSTVDENAHPDARVVLLKHFDARGFVFFTNYSSPKAKQLVKNPYACLSILWPALERQIRIRGKVEKTSRAESESYFTTRPHDAQIGAWASTQSQITSRKALEDSFLKLSKQFMGQEVPCPPHWGGFRLTPNYFEFWQGRTNRLHDRICFSRSKTGDWCINRLSP